MERHRELERRERPAEHTEGDARVGGDHETSAHERERDHREERAELCEPAADDEEPVRERNDDEEIERHAEADRTGIGRGERGADEDELDGIHRDRERGEGGDSGGDAKRERTRVHRRSNVGPARPRAQPSPSRFPPGGICSGR